MKLLVELMMVARQESSMFEQVFRIVYRKRRVNSRRRVSRRRKAPNRLDYLERKEIARTIVMERLAHFSQLYRTLDPANAISMKFAKVAIRNQRSRWGSCSANKNLNFNYRVLDLEPELRDYVIAHELCHLKELNHGKAFWDLLSLVIPNARALNHKARHMRIS